MTVLELINALIVECGTHNPADTKVNILKRYSADGWPRYEVPVVRSFEVVDQPFELFME